MSYCGQIFFSLLWRNVSVLWKWSKGISHCHSISLKRTGDKNKDNKQLGEMIVLKYLQILKTNMKRNMWDICKGKLIFSAYLRVKLLKIYEGMAVYEAEENPTMLIIAMRNKNNCKNKTKQVTWITESSASFNSTIMNCTRNVCSICAKLCTQLNYSGSLIQPEWL